jgi:hypothetical protein
MIIPNVPTDSMLDEKGVISKPWENFFNQSAQQQQQSLSNEGFWIPSVSSASDSVTPPTSGGQLAQLAASFYVLGTSPPQINPNGVQAGTIIFDPAEINGGSSGSPNGQLKVILADGVFHAITNT